MLLLYNWKDPMNESTLHPHDGLAARLRSLHRATVSAGFKDLPTAAKKVIEK